MKRNLLIAVIITLCVISAYGKAYKVTASSLNVRNAPNTSGTVLGSLAQSAEIDVIKITDGWAEINFKGHKAYVSAKYLTPVAATASQSESSKPAASTASSSSSSSSKATVEEASGKKAKKEREKNKSLPANFKDPVVAGFHASIGFLATERTSRLYDDNANKWRDLRIGRHMPIYGFSAGVGLEYNGRVYQGTNTLIMVGGRSGLYYDWSGTLKNTPADLSESQDDFEYFRFSQHSITMPLQPQLAFEWRTGGGKRIGLGVFTGPIFEFVVARNDVFYYDGDVTALYNSVSGKSRFLKGGDGQDTPERVPKAGRSGVLNMMWGTGTFVQFGKFRITASTDWGMYYKYMRGGTVEGTKIDPVKARMNRNMTFGFQIVF